MNRTEGEEAVAMARVSILVVCVLLLEGCAWFRAQLWRAGFTGESAEVTAVAKRDRYLDATLLLEEGSARFFFPSSYDCTQIIKAGSTVEVGDIGVLPRTSSAARTRSAP